MESEPMRRESLQVVVDWLGVLLSSSNAPLYLLAKLYCTVQGCTIQPRAPPSSLMALDYIWNTVGITSALRHGLACHSRSAIASMATPTTVAGFASIT